MARDRLGLALPAAVCTAVSRPASKQAPYIQRYSQDTDVGLARPAAPVKSVCNATIFQFNSKYSIYTNMPTGQDSRSALDRTRVKYENNAAARRTVLFQRSHINALLI